MKICPKCGREFEGSGCPFCTSPEIVVNNNEYLQRKKAYEEKQAKKVSSASSSYSESEAAKESMDEVFEKIKNNTTAVARKAHGIGKELKQKATSRAEKSTDKKGTGKKNRTVLFGCILAVVMLLVTVGAYGIYTLVMRKNYTLYMSYNDKIYDAASLDSSFVCNQSDAIFAADKKTFYIADWPESLNRNQLSESLASKNGKYFAATTYDSDTMIYTLYVWSKDGFVEVDSSKNSKSIKTITDEGCVIYSDTEVVNLEGNVGATRLFICDTYLDKSKETGEQLCSITTKVEDKLKSAYVYSHNDLIIYTNMSNKMYTYDYKNKKKSSIASVDSFYPMSAETPYLYEPQTSDEIYLSEAESFIYSSGGTYYFYDLESSKRITLGKVSGTNIAFIYEKKNFCMYIISSDVIECGEISEEGLKERRVLDNLGSSQNMIYMNENYRLIYINSSNQLMSLHKGTTKLIKEQVLDGSLNRVGNTESGITYITDGTQYYKASLSDGETAIYHEAEKVCTTDTYLYKNRLYFYNTARELYSCTKEGKSQTKIGNVERLWLGTELN